MHTLLTSTLELLPKCFNMSKLNTFGKLLIQRLLREAKLLRYNLYCPQAFLVLITKLSVQLFGSFKSPKADWFNKQKSMAAELAEILCLKQQFAITVHVQKYPHERQLWWPWESSEVQKLSCSCLSLSTNCSSVIEEFCATLRQAPPKGKDGPGLRLSGCWPPSFQLQWG